MSIFTLDNFSLRSSEPSIIAKYFLSPSNIFGCDDKHNFIIRSGQLIVVVLRIWKTPMINESTVISVECAVNCCCRVETNKVASFPSNTSILYFPSQFFFSTYNFPNVLYYYIASVYILIHKHPLSNSTSCDVCFFLGTMKPVVMIDGWHWQFLFDIIDCIRVDFGMKCDTRNAMERHISSWINGWQQWLFVGVEVVE